MRRKSKGFAEAAAVAGISDMPTNLFPIYVYETEMKTTNKRIPSLRPRKKIFLAVCLYIRW